MLGLLVVLFLGAVWFLNGMKDKKTGPVPVTDARATMPTKQPEEKPKNDHVPMAGQPATPPTTASNSESTRLVVVAIPVVTNASLTLEERVAQIDQLDEWSRNNDKQSLSNIVSRLTSPDKEVRAAAIEATKQFGSAEAIPSLKAASESVESLQEKIDYLEAIEFLSLPGMEVTPTTPEEAAKNRARIEAYRQAQTQKNAPAQNPAPPAQPR
jgi:hypothetical protein